MSEFEAAISHQKPHIIMLQSLGKNAPILDNYYVPDVKKEKTPAGKVTCSLATYIRTDIRVGTGAVPDFIPQPNLLYSSIHSEVGLIHLLNAYYPHGVKDANLDWMDCIPPNQKWLVGGDFNNHHREWDQVCNEKSLQSDLFNKIANSSLNILNSGEATRIPDHSKQSFTAPDITLATSALEQMIEWEVSDDSLGSDHLVLSSIIHTNPVFLNDHSPKYLFKQADWDRFRLTLGSPDKHLIQPEEWTQNDLVSAYNRLETRLQAAADLAIPKSKPRPQKRKCHKYYKVGVEITKKKEAFHRLKVVH